MRVPKVPMSPDEVPFQRLYEVASLPPPPAERIVIGKPRGVRLPVKPREADYLGQVEWAWSPMHNRLDAYYLHRNRSYWVLWARFFDENWGRFHWAQLACVPRKGVAKYQAAVHLLMAYWRAQRDGEELDQFHWINTASMLSVGDLNTIAELVWGDPDDTSSADGRAIAE